MSTEKNNKRMRLVTAIAVVLLIVGLTTTAVKKNRTVNQIQAMGGDVFYSCCEIKYDVSKQRFYLENCPKLPDWIVDVFGAATFYRVVTIDFTRKSELEPFLNNHSLQRKVSRLGCLIRFSEAERGEVAQLIDSSLTANLRFRKK